MDAAKVLFIVRWSLIHILIYSTVQTTRFRQRQTVLVLARARAPEYIPESTEIGGY